MSPVLHLLLLPLLFCIVSTRPCGRVIMIIYFMTMKQNFPYKEKGQIKINSIKTFFYTKKFNYLTKTGSVG